LIRDDELIIAEGRVEAADGQEETFIINDIKLLADAVPMKAKEMAIGLPENVYEEAVHERIFRLLSDNRGECDVRFMVHAEKVNVDLEPANIRVKGSSKLEKDLEKLNCSVNWIL
jgi:hypothetical protein